MVQEYLVDCTHFEHFLDNQMKGEFSIFSQSRPNFSQGFGLVSVVICGRTWGNSANCEMSL